MTFPEFDKVYNIMKKSFPPDEHRPHHEQKALLSVPEYLIRTLDVDGDIVGFIALWDFDDFTFIEHFALGERYRNRGLGGKFLRDTIHKINKPVCLEAEPPTDELTVRRIGFYNRCGFHLNGYHYIQPSISEGRSPVELKIMTYPHAVDESGFEEIRRVLYDKVYHVNM